MFYVTKHPHHHIKRKETSASVYITRIYITNNICRQDGKISSIWNEQGNFLCTSVFTYSSK